MDVTTITAAYNGLKVGKDILTALIEAKVDVASQSKVLEALGKLGQAQDILFELREELFRLQTDNDILRRRLAEYEGWDAKLVQYELIKTSGGAVVYGFKGEPKHFLCPSCIGSRQLQILQDNRTYSGKFRCPGCKNEYPVEPRKEGPTFRVQRHDPFG